MSIIYSKFQPSCCLLLLANADCAVMKTFSLHEHRINSVTKKIRVRGENLSAFICTIAIWIVIIIGQTVAIYDACNNIKCSPLNAININSVMHSLQPSQAEWKSRGRQSRTSYQIYKSISMSSIFNRWLSGWVLLTTMLNSNHIVVVVAMLRLSNSMQRATKTV